MMSEYAHACEICGAHNWQVIYKGFIRNGSFGNFSSSESRVFKCLDCGVQRLEEDSCYEDSIYESDAYRSILNQNTDAKGFFDEHDVLQLRQLEQLWPESLRGKVIVDVGCAAGAFLDHISGLAETTVAVEPCKIYHQSLRQRGHQVFSSCQQLDDLPIDLVTSFSVIEHVANPRNFLEEIANIMSVGGKLLISTPNRNDVLSKLIPEEYASFFYRSVHRWYFDADSLAKCAEISGFRVIQKKCVHRFGIGNAIAWLRDKKPSGLANEGLFGEFLDVAWKTSLQDRNLGDYLYFWLEKR